MKRRASKEERLQKLRVLITESIRIQRDSPPSVGYIDPGTAVTSAISRQNHVVFARRGCGKSLLLHSSADKLPDNVQRVYINCEDFKHHSFPNVLIEILVAIFTELQNHSSGWFGKKRRLLEISQEILDRLNQLKKQPDEVDESVKRAKASSRADATGTEVSVGLFAVPAKLTGKHGASDSAATARSEEIEFRRTSKKLESLNQILPDIKAQLREFFGLSTKVKAVLIQIDDFYHLKIADQPFVIDYVHRLCKDLPLYFKVATLKHASSLFITRDRQPIGAQQRHDYLPIDIDFTFEDFKRTEKQVWAILLAYGQKADLNKEEMEGLFKGEGFRRLVLAGGGVPRDCLSLFLDGLTKAADDDGRIGKDTMRLLNLSILESRIRELKEDSQADEKMDCYAASI